MSKIPERILSVARSAGSAQYKAAKAAIEHAFAVGDFNGSPDLARKTRERSMMMAGIEALGSYQPGSIALKTKKQMRKDGQLRWSLAAAKAPVVSAPFYFDTRSRELAALLDALFLQTNLVRSLVRKSLNAFDFGFQNHEILWETDSIETAWDVPNESGGMDVKKKTWDTIFIPSRFKDLDPTKVTILKDEWGDMVGSVYGAETGTAPEQIKELIRKNEVNVLQPEKMFLYTPILEYQNYYGEGRLEWAYDPWYWQNILYMIALRWYERKADPPLVVYAPTMTQMADPLQDGGEEFDETADSYSSLVLAAQAAEKLRSSGSVALPSEVFMDDEGRPSTTRAWHMEELSVQDLHPAFLDMIDHLDKKKTRAVWASDLALSRDRQVGSLGTPEQVASLMVDTQNDSLNALVDAFNEQVLAPFLGYNGIKDKASLATTGVQRENKSLLRDLILKIVEADMLAEQSWGRIFPQSTTQMIDREAILRETGVPYKKPDPNAPMPKPVPLPTQEDPSNPTDPKAGRDNISNKKAGGTQPKRRSGLSMDRALDTMNFEGEMLVGRAADDMEAWVDDAARSAPARETLETHEKALIAIMLWYLIRAPKKDQSGKKIPGSKAADKLVFKSGRTFLPTAALAAALQPLTELVQQFEGRGWTISASGSTNFLVRAQGGIQTTLAGLQQAVIDGMPLREYVYAAIDRARFTARDLMTRTASTYADLSPDEIEQIIDTNVRGILLNIENIAIRNTQKATEGILMGTGAERALGMIDDAFAFRFNTLYSDLTLEAHLRATHRAAMVSLGKLNDVRYFVKIPTRREDGEFDETDFKVATLDWWNAEGERRGAPNPASTFGFHPGSKSYWFPVPDAMRVRSPLP